MRKLKTVQKEVITCDLCGSEFVTEKCDECGNDLCTSCYIHIEEHPASSYCQRNATLRSRYYCKTHLSGVLKSFKVV